jgi:hypothetical protein
VVLNRRRLPVSKEAKIDAYRSGLEAAGVDTAGWFERQLGLSIIAVMATFLWGKALGDAADELAWWFAHVAKAQAWLPRPRRRRAHRPAQLRRRRLGLGRLTDGLPHGLRRGPGDLQAWPQELGCTVVPGT